MAASVLASSVTLTGGLTAPASAAGTSPAVPAADAGVDEPLVIAHRGASGYRPEHTLAAYKLAIQMGADYVEPDLVSTKDGVLVARHENEISGTTDVADHPEFADRRTTKVVDGHEVTGWFTEDFTLAELKTLRAEERLPDVRPGNTRYDGRYQVPTFDEVLDLVARESRRRGEVVGVYPETKHPTYFDSVGLSLEEPLVEALQRHHLNRPNARVYIQSFETGNLRELADTVRVPLVQLVDATGAPYDLQAAGDPGRTPTSSRARGCGRSRRTPTRSAPTRTSCCRGTRRATWPGPRRSSTTPTTRASTSTSGRCATRTSSWPGLPDRQRPERQGRRVRGVRRVLRRRRRRGVLRLLRHRGRGPRGMARGAAGARRLSHSTGT